MGLDTTHGCWSGAYSAFARWRKDVAAAVGIPLDLMDGFYRPLYIAPGTSEMTASAIAQRESALPIRWDLLKPDILHVLLNHSDCDGSIAHADCKPLAERLAGIIDMMPGNWRLTTQAFIDGLMSAHEAGEDVEFR